MGSSLGAKAKPQKKNTLKTTAKAQKARRKKAGGLGHKQLDQEFIYVGKVMRARAKTGKPRPLSTMDPHASKVGRIFRDKSVVMSKPRFGRTWRAVEKNQDELVSTSSLREILSGAFSAKGGHSQELEDAIVKISKVRFPTWATGFSLKGKIMQHPTGPGDGLFAESADTAKLHSELDLNRKQETAKAMMAEAKNPGSNADSIANAGIRAAVGYTLNVFLAPASASDVRPYLKGKSISPARVDQQVKARETLKAILVKAGGVQETDTLSPTARRSRQWGNRSLKRSASPAR